MTIDFYNDNAVQYFEKTKNVDMQNIYAKFEKNLKSKSYILDLGCGSGRDTKYFLQKGYKVDAIDGSIELCKIASKYTGINVQCMNFNNITFSKHYDAIWACASLLHLPMDELISIYVNLLKKLNNDGIFYSSFKYGNNEEIVDGKFYNNLNEEKIGKLLTYCSNIKEFYVFYNIQSRSDNKVQKWINLIVHKL